MTQLLDRHHTVDDTVLVQILGGLDAIGKWLVVQSLIHPRAEEPDEGLGFGDGDVGQ